MVRTCQGHTNKGKSMGQRTDQTQLLADAIAASTKYPIFWVNVYTDPEGTKHKIPALNRDICAAHGWGSGSGDDFKAGFYAATQDRATIEAMMKAAGDRASAIGVATGAADLVVIDDDRAKKEDPIAEAFFARHAAELAEARIHRTTSGGKHYIFAASDQNIVSSRKSADAIDIRGASGFVVWPPSLGYSVEHDVDPPQMSRALLADLLRMQTADRASGAADAGADLSGVDLEELEKRIRTGADFHYTTLEITKRWALAGMEQDEALARLMALYDEARPASGAQLGRWQKARKDAERALDGALRRFKPRDERAALDALAQLLGVEDDPEIPVEDPGPVDDPVHGHVPRPLDQYEPRRWLLGNILIRQFVTVLAGSGGGGKTSLAIGWALSLASGKPVMGERVGKPRRVLIWSEDPPEELAKRVDAAMQIHGLTRADIEDRLIVVSIDELKITIARFSQELREVIAVDLPALKKIILSNKLDVVMLDPIAELHELEENDNVQMAKLMGMMRSVARETKAAILLLHHASKASVDAGKKSAATATRGAGAIVNSARVSMVLNEMTAKDAEDLGIREDERPLYGELTRPKANMGPRTFGGDFVKVELVPFGNGDEENDEDVVAVSVPWKPTAASQGERFGDMVLAVQILQTLPPQERRTKGASRADYPVAKALGLDLGYEKAKADLTKEESAARGRVTAVLSQLVGMGALEVIDFKDPGPGKNHGKAYEVTKGGLALVENMIEERAE
jgi:KaiC/GvpD/RAD55 family RecA-like ATPase